MNELYNHVGLTYEAIGKVYGITRERVRQILIQFGYETGRPPRPDPLCLVCKKSYIPGKYKDHYQAEGHKKSHGHTGELMIERNEGIVRDYFGPMTLDEIGAKWGIPAPSIYPILRRRGIVPSRGGGRYERTPETLARLSASQGGRHLRNRTPPPEVILRRRGVGPTRIGRALGRHPQAVAAMLSRWSKSHPSEVYPPIDGQAPIGSDDATRSGPRPAAPAGPQDTHTSP